MQILHDNAIHIYERLGHGEFQKKKIKLPDYALSADIKDNIIVYCNRTTVGIITTTSPKEKILWKSFGNIIDFNVSINSLVIDNYHDNLCKLYQIRKGITIDPTPFATHIKKRALETMQAQEIYSIDSSDYLLIRNKSTSTYALYDQIGQ